MFTTKHQIVRYNKLDKCFQNFGRSFGRGKRGYN